MTTAEKIAFYMPQINSMVAFAKRIGYDMATGDIMELASLWNKDGLKTQLFIEDNKENFMQTVKCFLPKQCVQI